MKTIVIPPPVKCAKAIAPTGELDLATFIRELVFIRPGWRERGKASFLLEIDEALNTPVGKEAKWSDEAHEVLCQECAMRDIQLRWDLATVVAQFQLILYSA